MAFQWTECSKQNTKKSEQITREERSPMEGSREPWNISTWERGRGTDEWPSVELVLALSLTPRFDLGHGTRLCVHRRWMWLILCPSLLVWTYRRLGYLFLLLTLRLWMRLEPSRLLLPLWDGGARTLYSLITTFVASRSATPSAYGRNPKARTRFIARKGKPMRPYLIRLVGLDHSGGLNLCFRMNPSLGMTPDLNLWGLLTPVKSSNLAH